jgi:hypothetical protein
MPGWIGGRLRLAQTIEIGHPSKRKMGLLADVPGMLLWYTT